jgi:hypothetical protein
MSQCLVRKYVLYLLTFSNVRSLVNRQLCSTFRICNMSHLLQSHPLFPQFHPPKLKTLSAAMMTGMITTTGSASRHITQCDSSQSPPVTWSLAHSSTTTTMTQDSAKPWGTRRNNSNTTPTLTQTFVWPYKMR